MDASGVNTGELTAMRAVAGRLRAFPRAIGRYAVAERLGEGGMGTVYGAFDPKLKRRVAIKLIRRIGGIGGIGAGARRRERALREARSLAAVVHPNVVEIYEVGVHEGRPFFVMEHIDAQTLNAWVEQFSPSWHEVLDAYLQAGHGLEAAHTRGIIHRDFKPSNVLIDDDARVRVVDFGLARLFTSESDEDTTEVERVSCSESATQLDPRLTATGIRIGTPAYMAPEQYRGDPLTPAADQFSFCVAVWQALFGRRPFDASDVDRYLELIDRANPRPGKGVPRRIVAVLRRGLRAQPRDRFGSMTQLLNALQRAKQRRAVPVAATGLLVAGSLGAGSWAPRGSECVDPAYATEEVWTEQRRGQLSASFARAGMRSWPRVDVVIGDYVTQWRTYYERACETAEVTECLDGRLSGLDGFIGLLEEGDTAVLGTAVEAASRLPSLVECDDPSTASALPGNPERMRVAALEASLTRVLALIIAGDFGGAATLAASVAAEARQLGHEPLLASAVLAQGRAHSMAASADQAIDRLTEAHELALGVGDDESAMLAAILLAQQWMAERGDYEAALGWWRHAEAAAARQGLENPPAEYLGLHGLLLRRLERHDEAIVVFNRARAVLEQAAPGSEREAAETMRDLGRLASYVDDHDRAARLLTEALALADGYYGESSLTSARFEYDLARVLLRVGDVESAAGHLRRVRTVLDAVLEHPHPQRAQVTGRLGTALLRLGRIEEATAMLEAAVRELERLHPASHERVIYARGTLADAYLAAHRLDQARALLDELLTTVEAALGADSVDHAEVLFRRGQVAEKDGDPQVAHTYYARAVKIFAASGSHSPGADQAREALRRVRGAIFPDSASERG